MTSRLPDDVRVRDLLAQTVVDAAVAVRTRPAALAVLLAGLGVLAALVLAAAAAATAARGEHR